MNINDIIKQLLLNVLHVKYKLVTSDTGSKYYKFTFKGEPTTIRVSDHKSTHNKYPVDIVIPVLDKDLSKKERNSVEAIIRKKYSGFKIWDKK